VQAYDDPGVIYHLILTTDMVHVHMPHPVGFVAHDNAVTQHGTYTLKITVPCCIGKGHGHPTMTARHEKNHCWVGQYHRLRGSLDRHHAHHAQALLHAQTQCLPTCTTTIQWAQTQASLGLFVGLAKDVHRSSACGHQPAPVGPLNGTAALLFVAARQAPSPWIAGLLHVGCAGP
jgi:hypothetical protein